MHLKQMMWINKIEIKLQVLATSWCPVESHSSWGAGRLWWCPDRIQSLVEQPVNCGDIQSYAFERESAVAISGQQHSIVGQIWQCWELLVMGMSNSTSCSIVYSWFSQEVGQIWQCRELLVMGMSNSTSCSIVYSWFSQEVGQIWQCWELLVMSMSNSSSCSIV